MAKSFAVAGFGADGVRRSRKAVLRKALFASSALVGVTLAGPVEAQSISPSGGGTINAPGATISGGGANQGVLVQGAGATVNGVNITNTGNTPTADGLQVVGPGGQGVGINIASTSTITSQTGDGVRLQSGGSIENIGFGVAVGQTLNVTGVVGVSLGSNQNIFLPNTGSAGTIVATARTNGSGTGVSLSASGGIGGSLGNVSATGFNTGIGLTANGAGAVVEGGTISARGTGINVVSTSNIILSSQAAITAPTGISATTSGGAISVTTGAGGTINSGNTGNTGVYVSGATGANTTAIAIGAAIGGTTQPNTGIDATGAGVAGDTIAINANVSGGSFGVYTRSAFTTTIGAGAMALGGTYGLNLASTGGTVANDGTVSGYYGVISNSLAALKVTNTGSITGSEYGINGGASPSASINNASVTNSGTISAAVGSAINLYNGGIVTNSGTITGGSDTGAGFGVYLGGPLNRLDSTGTINGGAAGAIDLATFGTTTLNLNAGSTTTGGVQVQYGTATETIGGTVNGAFTLTGASGQTVYGSDNFTVLAGGVINGAATAITTDRGLTLANAGKIVGSANGVVSTGSTATITNTGTIGGGTLDGNGNFAAGGAGFAIQIASGTVTNSGTLQSGGAALNQTSNTGTLKLVNTGMIGSLTPAGAPHNFDPDDTLVASGTSTIFNSGTIASPNFFALNIQGGSLVNAATGVISAGTAQNNRYGVLSGDATIAISNYGSITSTSTDLQRGIQINDSAANTATINLHAGSTTGAIVTGAGNDTLTLYTGTGTSATGATYDSATNAVTAGITTGATKYTVQAAGTNAAAAFVTGATVDLGGGTNTLTLAGAGDGNANGAVGTFNVSGLTGATKLVKQDTGTWMVTGTPNGTPTTSNPNLNFSEGVSVLAGTLAVETGSNSYSSNALGSGAVAISGGATVRYDNPYATGSLGPSSGQIYVSSNQVTGTGTLAFAGGAGSLTVLDHLGTGTIEDVALSATGLITVQSGAVLARGTGVFAGNQAGLNIASGASFDGASDVITIDALTGGGAYTGTGTLQIGVAGGSGTFTGTIANEASALSVTKTGAGTQTLTGVNTYTGGMTISGGTLRLLNISSASGTTQIGSGATLELANTNAASANPSVVVGPSTFTGTGTIVKSGTGYSAFGGNGVVNINLSQGALIDVQGGLLAGSSSFQGIWTNNQASLNVASGATFNGVEGAIFVDALTGSGTVLGGQGGFARTTTVGVANGSGTFAGVLGDFTGDPNSKLALTKAGTGTQTLTGVNTYTGQTAITGGMLALSGSGSIANSATVVNFGSFDISGRTSGTTVNQLRSTGTIVLGANTLTANETSAQLISGVISGSGGFTKSGAGNLTLSGANTYTGTTTIGAGTLTGTTASIVGSSIVDNAALVYTQAASGTAAQAISGSGTIAVSGLTTGNTLTFNGALSNTGGLTATGSSVTLNVGAAGGIFENGVGARTLTIAGGSATNATSNTNGSGLYVQTTSGTTTVSVAAGATLSTAAGSGTNRDGITALTNTLITNNGTISSNYNSAIALAGGGSINNFATITGGTGGNGYGIAVSNGSAATVMLQSASVVTGTQGGVTFQSTGTGANSAQLSNAGQISSARYGIEQGGTGTPAIINLATGKIVGGAGGVVMANATTITNAGLIGLGTLDGAGAYTFSGTGYAVNLAAASTVTNSGTIRGGGAAIFASSGLSLTNTGNIYGGQGFTGNTQDAVYAAGSATVLNAGSITTTQRTGTVGQPTYAALNLAGGGTVTNAAAGILTGGTDATYGDAIQMFAAGTFNNYGMATGSGAGALNQFANAVTTVNLFAGSTTGSITTLGANDTVSIYSGRGTSGLATVDGSSGITLQNGGTLAAATVGTIGLGGGSNTLNLNGVGDGSTANGVAGSINLSTVTGATTLAKFGTGTWTLTGSAASTGVSQINAGGGTPAGLLIFNATSNLASAINVNGTTIRATSAGAFGTGIITATDPTIQYGATGTYANNIVLASTDKVNDPTRLQADNGVNATLSGVISEANAGQPLVINTAGSTGTITLTRNNTYTGLTTVAGGTLVVNGTNQSGVTVNSGATLTGTGSVGATTIADGGNLTGAQGSTLTMASLGLTSGSIINATFGASGGAGLFAVTGNLTLDGTVNVADTGAFGFGVYRLISYDGMLTDNGLMVGATPSDAQRTTVQTSVAGQVNIVSSSGTLQFWDGDNPALYNNGQINGGSGTWTTTSQTFTDANGLSNGAMTPQPGMAVFEAAPGIVTVDSSMGAIAVTGLQFASSGYVVTGDAIALADPSGTTVIRVGDGTAAGAGYRATIGSALTGASGLNKTDFGTLVLSGANGYTGTTTVSGGTLQGTTTSIVGSNIVDNATLAYNQTASGTVSQAISGSGVVTVAGLAVGNALTFTGVDTQTGGFRITDASNTVFAGTATGAVNEVSLQGNGATLTNNAGSVIVGGTNGIDATGPSTVNNSGTIAAGTYNAGTGAITLGGTDGVYLAAGGTVTNNAGGLIEGARQGVEFGAAGGRLNNAGTITSTGNGNAVADFDTTSTGVIVANSGTINFVSPSAGALGVAFYGTGNKIVNTGTISADIGVELQNAGTSTLVNGQGGQITGTTYAVQTSGAGNTTFSNYGTTTGPLSVLGTGANALSLQAGSSTGAITTGSGADTLSLYTGSVTTAAVVDATTGLTVQSAGTHAAATFGAINLGAGANVLNLRGAGDATAANGAAASLVLNTITNVGTITKQDAGTWTLTGAATPSVAAATINAGVGGTPGSGGLLIFSGAGLTGTINVNGATIRATTGAAFGTGTIYEVDPTTQFAATATYANNFVLQSANPATDPTLFQTFGAGVVATLSGTITQGAGVAAQPLVFGSINTDGTQGTGTFVLTNAGNAWTGVTTVNAGTTLRGTTATLSGASFTDNGVLNFNQAAAGTSARAISGTGTVLVDGGGPVTLTGAITAAGGVQVGANTTATLSNVSGNGNTTVFLSGNNAVLNVAQGGTITATNGGAVFGTAQNGTVNNAGTVTSTGNFSAIFFNPNLGTATVTNTGNVNAFGSAVSSGVGTVLTVNNMGVLNSTNRPAIQANGAATVTNGAAGTMTGFSGIYANGALTLNNAGQITAAGAGGNAVTANGGGTIINTGTLTATTTGGWAVQMSGAGSVDNQGTINADSGLVATIGTGVSLTNEGTITAASNGVWGYGTSVNLTNSGTITGGGATGTAGVRGEAAGSSITNSGTIAASSTAGVGVYLTGGTLTNQSGGTISGGAIAGGGYGTAIQLAGTGNMLALQAGSAVNGLIDASATTDGSNGYTFSGNLNGGFTGGSGNDTVTLVTPVTVTGTLDGGAGTDTLVLDGAGAGTLASAQVVNFENGVKQGSGTWTLTGTTAASPTAFAINAGTLAVAGGNALADNGAVTIASGATLQLNNSETIGSLAGAGNVTLGANTLTTGGLNASPTFSGVASGTGGLTKVGTGTLTLAGANSYTGATTVSAGTLALGATNAIGAGSAVTVASGATLTLATYNDTVASLALNGTLAGTGTLTAATYTLNGAVVNANLGAGTLTQAGGTSVLNGTAAAATVNVTGGTLSLGANDRLADNATVLIANGAALNMAMFTDTVGLAQIAGTLNGTGTLTAAEYDLSGATVNANLGTGNVFQQAGTSTLNGTSNAANVMVTGGTLVLGASNRLADTAAVGVASGATLNLGANTDTVGTLALNGTLAGTGTLTATTYTLNNAAVNANLGTGTLVQASGTSVLSGTAATNMVAVMAGTLRLGASDRIADAAMLGVASGATFDLAGYNETVGTLAGGGTLSLGAGTLTAGGTNADYAFGGNVTGTGDLTKVGTGTFSLIGNEAMTGRLNVNAGTLMLAGTTAGSVRVQGGTLTGASTIAGNLLLSSGTLSPGIQAQPVAAIQAGSLTVTGGTTVFDFGGMASGFTADLLKVTGAATLTGGTVTTRGLDPSASYKMEQVYTVVQAGTLTGTYASGSTFTQVSNNADLYYRLRYDLLANGVVLEVRKPVDFTTMLGTGASGNQLAVARALNGGVLTGSDAFVTALNAISQLSPDQRRSTLDNLGGESIADISTSVALVGNRFNELLRHRLAVGGAGNSADPSLIAGIAGGKRGLDQVRASGQVGAEGSSFADGSADNHAGAWVQTFGGAGKLDGLGGTASIRDQSYGVAAGIDVKVAGLSVGGAFAASALDTRVAGRSATNTGTLYQGGGYVAYDNGTAYASAVGSYFSGDVTSSRQVYIGAAFQGTATGTPKVTGYTAGGAAGYRVAVGGGVRFTPQVSFQATHVDRAAFTETGAGVLSLSAGKDVRNLYTATAEGRLSYLGAAPGGIIEPYVGAGAAFAFGDLNTVSANQFTGAPTGTGAFSITGARLSPTTALINGGIEAHPNDRVTLGMGVETRLSNRQRDGRVELHVRLGF